MLGTDTADLLDLLPEPCGDASAGPSGRWSASVPDLLDGVVTGRPDGAARARAARALLLMGPTVAATAAAAALDLVPWPDGDTVARELADPVAASRTVAALGDRVLGAASTGAVGAGRPDVAWLFALAPRPVPFFVRMGDALACDPVGEQRLAQLVRAFRCDLVDPATAGRPDGAAAVAQLLHRVPAIPVGPGTTDALVDLLVAARRRGTPARGVVDAAVGLLARLDRSRTDAAPEGPAPDSPAPDGPAADGSDASAVSSARQRQARIDGTRAAVALLSELQSYPPVARDPRGIWDELVSVAREHGLTAVGVRGSETSYDRRLHELLCDDDWDEDWDEEGHGEGDERDSVPDRSVMVVRSGYTWGHGGEVVVLQRALVRPVERE